MEKIKTILVVEIVEDDTAVKNALSEKLLHEGFSVLEAKDGEEGLRLALTKHPDLILLDLKMPVMDGMTMLKILRADEWGKNTPVIILSNMSDSESIAEAINQNAFEFFLKSDVSLEEVVKKIKEKLGMSGAPSKA